MTTLQEPSVILTRCLTTKPEPDLKWHQDPFHQFIFVTNGSGLIGDSVGTGIMPSDSLVLYHENETHASNGIAGQQTQFWLLQFHLPQEFETLYPNLMNSDPARRRWNLRSEQVEAFRWMFIQIHNESSQPGEDKTRAQNAWLRLLLISVNRWAAQTNVETIVPSDVNPSIYKLWHLINASVDQPAVFRERAHHLGNYDSLRHGFKRVFKVAPSEMMTRLRVQHAKRLLRESSLSIKEIAYRSGYNRPHEFARAFRRHTGVPPTTWRGEPLERLSA